MPFRVGPMELIIVMVLVMIIFGVGRLPEVGSSVGKAIKEFRHTMSSDSTDDADDEKTNNIEQN